MSDDPPIDDREADRGGGALLLRTWSDGEALLVRQLLATYGIRCQVVSDVPHSVLPIAVDGLGEIRIVVPASRLDEARGLLADHLRQGLRVIDGDRGRDDDGADDGDVLDDEER